MFVCFLSPPVIQAGKEKVEVCGKTEIGGGHTMMTQGPPLQTKASGVLTKMLCAASSLVPRQSTSKARAPSGTTVPAKCADTPPGVRTASERNTLCSTVSSPSSTSTTLNNAPTASLYAMGDPVAGTPVFGASVAGDTVLGCGVIGASVLGDSVFGDSVLGASVSGASVLGGSVLGGSVSGASVEGADVFGAVVAGGVVGVAVGSGAVQQRESLQVEGEVPGQGRAWAVGRRIWSDAHTNEGCAQDAVQHSTTSQPEEQI